MQRGIINEAGDHNLVHYVPNYSKTVWVDNKTWVEQEALNKIENQIELLTRNQISTGELVDEMNVSITEILSAVNSMTESIQALSKTVTEIKATLDDHLSD